MTNLIGAYYDSGEWQEIPLLNSVDDIETAVMNYSKRRLYLCGIFDNPTQVGVMIFDTPLMLFLHGVKYTRDINKMSLDDVVENIKAGVL